MKPFHREPEPFYEIRKEKLLTVEHVREISAFLWAKSRTDVTWKDLIRTEKVIFALKRHWCSVCRRERFAAPMRHRRHDVWVAEIDQEYLGDGLILERGRWKHNGGSYMVVVKLSSKGQWGDEVVKAEETDSKWVVSTHRAVSPSLKYDTPQAAEKAIRLLANKFRHHPA